MRVNMITHVIILPYTYVIMLTMISREKKKPKLQIFHNFGERIKEFDCRTIYIFSLIYHCFQNPREVLQINPMVTEMWYSMED